MFTWRTSLLLLTVGCGSLDGATDVTTNASRTAGVTAPVADAGADSNVLLGSDATVDGSGSYDPDGDPITYRWKVINTPSGSAVTSNSLVDRNASSTTFTPDVAGNYVLNLKVNDGLLTHDDTVTVSVTDPSNNAPVADAGSDSTESLGGSVALDASGSTDADGDTLSFRWKFISVPGPSSLGSNDIDDRDAEITSFIPDVVGAYVASVKANDGVAEDSAQVTITVTSGSNTPPTADAGADATGEVGQAVSMDASGSSDADGDPLTYRWKFISVAPGSSLTSNSIADRNAATTSFTPDVTGTYVANVKVDDGLVTVSDDVTYTVSTGSNDAPTADAGADQAAFVDDIVTLDGSGSSDPDGDTLTYRWKLTTKPASSAVTSESMSDRDDPTPFFTPDVIGTYTFRLKVSDADFSDVDTVDIDVTEDTGVGGGDTASGVSLVGLDVGDLVISEMMINPSDCSDPAAEYFEIHNQTNAAVDLDGLVIQSNSGSDTISGSTVVAADSYAIGVRFNGTTRCYGLAADFQYDVKLSNLGDDLSISYGSTVFDEVDFSSWIVPAGASLQLSTMDDDADSNDSETSWCEGRVVFSGASDDLGSPGQVNDCASAICGDGAVDTGEECDDGDTQRGDGCNAQCEEEYGYACAQGFGTTGSYTQAETMITGGTAADPIWIFSNFDQSVEQTENSKPTVFHTDWQGDDSITMTIRVDDTTDDDFVGFTIGLEPGDSTSSSANYLLVDWKQVTQGNGGAGLALSEVTGAVASTDLYDHVNGVAEIARAASLGSTGWTTGTAHEFQINADSSSVEIYVDGNLEFSETGTFPAGRISLYTLSQKDVTFTLTDPTTSACTLDTGDTSPPPTGDTVDTGSPASCPDGQVTGTEECDDGNSDTGDGCDGSCVIEAGFDCVEGFEVLSAITQNESLITSGTADAPQWALSTDGLTATQATNSQPTAFHTDWGQASGQDINVSFTVQVNTTTDNDYIGWTIGLDPGEVSSSSASWLLFDWKQTTQGLGTEGLTMSEVAGTVTASDLYDHTNNVSEVATATTLGSTGWADNTTYTVEVQATATQVDVWVDSVLEFSESGTFPVGRLSLYGLSQQDIEFNALDPVYSVCEATDSGA